MNCFKCGMALQANSNACGMCGAVHSNQVQQAPQAPPQQHSPSHAFPPTQNQQFTPQPQFAPQPMQPPQHVPPPQQHMPPPQQHVPPPPPTPLHSPPQFAPQPDAPNFAPGPQFNHQPVPPPMSSAPPIVPQQTYAPPPQAQQGKSRTPIFIGIGVVAALIIALIVVVLLRNGPAETDYVPTGLGTEVNDPIEADPIADPTPAPEPDPTPAPLPDAVLTGAQIFEKNRDAVIIIRTEGGGFIGTGSGFFVCSTGIAVTNHHVMVDWSNAIAVLYDGREFAITGYYSYDVENDLAVIQVDGQGYQFTHVVLGDSAATRVGEDVFAIGGPDWDPITFTPGMISRIAQEPINFGIYTIEGLFQSTAAIYGGNSGGPLVNNRGHVIGVNAAGNTLRASVQFAVPIDRVVLPTPGSGVNPLPMGGVFTPPMHTPGQMFTYARFPSVPDFLSVSPNASLFFSGTPLSLGLTAGDIIYDFYEYLFMYFLPYNVWSSDTLDYEDALWDAGFFFQEEVDFGDEIWVYFFNPDLNLSVSYAYIWDEEILLIAIVSGDVYTLFYSDGIASGNEFGIEPDWDLDLTLVGTWRFWETNDSFYQGLMNAGDDVLYIFAPDGTGYWGSIGANGVVNNEIALNWATNEGFIVLDFPLIDLVLLYEYFLVESGGEKDLFFYGDTDHHLYFIGY